MTFTPTTESIKAYYAPGQSPHQDQRAEAFDRWLEAHDLEVKAQALEEAAEESRQVPFSGPMRGWLRDRAQQLKEKP